MNGTLPNNNMDYFNELDYGSAGNSNTEESSGDSDTYLKKSGDSMNGTLQINNHIRFNDNTIQTTAFNDETITLINDALDRIGEIDVSGDVVQIPKLECDSITFPSGVQTKPYTLNNVVQSGSDIAFNNASTSLKDSIVDSTINNPFNAFSYFDKSLAFMRSSSIYRKFWMGLTGDNVNDTNNFAIGTDTDILLDLNHEGKLKISNDFEIIGTGKKIVLNGEDQNHAFTDDLHNDLNNVAQWTDRCIFNNSSTDFLYPVTFDSNTTPGEITISNQNITFPDASIQTTAFKPVHKDVLDHISKDSNDNVIIDVCDNHLIIKSTVVRFENETGGQQSSLFVDSIVIKGNVQTVAFTQPEKSKIAELKLSSNKLLLQFDAGWEILNRGRFLYDEYIGPSLADYNIMSHPSLYNQSTITVDPILQPKKWGAGNRRIRIKYSINFKSEKSKVWFFKSKIIQKRVPHTGGNETEISSSLFAGEHNNIERALDFYEVINYNDDLVIDVKTDDGLYLITWFKVDCSWVHTLNLEARFCIEEL